MIATRNLRLALDLQEEIARSRRQCQESPRGDVGSGTLQEEKELPVRTNQRDRKAHSSRNDVAVEHAAGLNGDLVEVPLAGMDLPLNGFTRPKKGRIDGRRACSRTWSWRNAHSCRAHAAQEQTEGDEPESIPLRSLGVGPVGLRVVVIRFAHIFPAEPVSRRRDRKGVARFWF